jgi:hypothetical protein
MPSVGPFELTEVEFIGLEFLRQDDERQLRKTTLRASWSGRELRVRAEGLATIITDAQRRDRFQGPAILENQLENGTRKHRNHQAPIPITTSLGNAFARELMNRVR